MIRTAYGFSKDFIVSYLTKMEKQELTITASDMIRAKIRMGIPVDEDENFDIKLYYPVKNKQGLSGYAVPRYFFEPSVTRIEEFVTSRMLKCNTIDFQIAKEKTPSPQQEKTINASLANIKKFGGSVIVAKPAEGKTFMGCNIIAHLKMKTLILVHKDFLAEQWRKELKEVLGLEDNEIGTLRNGKFKDGKVVIGTFQSLMTSTFGKEINNLFDFIVVDEVHTLPTRMFLRSFTRFNRIASLGLTATPKREDGMERYSYLHLSSNLVMHENVRNMPVEVGIAEFVHSDKPYIPSYLPYLVGLKMYLEKNVDRNMFIFSYIVKLASKKMVVLSDRIAQLDFMAAQYRREFPNKKVCRMYGAKKLTKKQRAQGMKQEIIPTPTQIEMDSADILFATYQKASLGLNVETLEGLILAMPFSSKVMLEQTIGRVQRLMQGKEPFVVDFADKGIRMLEGMADKRYTMYRKWGYKVDYF